MRVLKGDQEKGDVEIMSIAGFQVFGGARDIEEGHLCKSYQDCGPSVRLFWVPIAHSPQDSSKRKKCWTNRNYSLNSRLPQDGS